MKFLLVAIILLCLPLSFAQAQWKELLSFSGGRPKPFRTIYFLTDLGCPNIGFALTEGRGVYKTTDAGNTWRNIPMPESDNLIDLRDIVFMNKDTGWIATYFYSVYGSDYGNILKTTDGGETWSPQLPAGAGGNFVSIYYDQKKHGLFASSWSSSLLVSWDGGTTWATLPTSEVNNGFSGFNEDTIILSGVGAAPLGTPPATNWLRTTDGGNFWSSTPMDSEVWQPLAIKGTTTGFAISDYTGTVLRTDDLWDHWTSVYPFPHILDSIDPYEFCNSAGCIRGDSCNLFTQVAAGFYFSIDQGNDWLPIGNVPSRLLFDRRFWVDQDKILISTADFVNVYLWRLDVRSFLRDYYGISPRFDDGSQQTSLSPGDSVGVTFVPGAGTLAATDSVTLVIRYDPDAVSLSALRVPNGWWISDSSTTCSTPLPPPLAEEGGCSLHLTLRSDSAESLPDPLLHAEFHTFLSPSESRAGNEQAGSSAPRAFIYLDSAQSYFPYTTPCAPTALSLQQSDSVELDFTGCADSLLETAMNHAPPFTIESIVPNPAQTEVTVTLSGMPGPAPGVTYQLFDALGRTTLSKKTLSATTTLDVSRLPSGTYYLRASDGAYVVTQKIVIKR